MSRTTVARLSFTESARFPSDRGLPVGSHVLRKKHMVEPNFVILIDRELEAEDTGRKLFAFLPSCEESGTTFGLLRPVGASQYNMSKPYFSNCLII